jgi:hypothetical protein
MMRRSVTRMLQMQQAALPAVRRLGRVWTRVRGECTSLPPVPPPRRPPAPAASLLRWANDLFVSDPPQARIGSSPAPAPPAARTERGRV